MHIRFKKAKYKNIVVMDGDLQHKPSDIKKIINIFFKENIDLAVGTRELFKKKEHNLNFFRLFASRFLILVVNLLLGKKTSDPMSGFFMFKRKIFINSEKRLIIRGYKILLDLLYIKNRHINVVDVQINFNSRIKGRSKMSLKILFSLVLMIIQKFLREV